MPLSELGGPLIVFGGSAGGNPDFGPSLFRNGAGLMDPRFSYPYGAAGLKALGFSGSTYIPTINAVPSALTTTAIAAAQTPTAGTKLTLVTSTGAGITVVPTGGVQVMPSGVTIPAGTLAIDGLPGTVFLGSSGAVQLYDPSKALARAVTISCNGNDGTGTYTVQGFDIYGFAMSEAITGSATSSTVTGAKAFKFITSITPSGTINSTSVSAGQSDKYGFPLRADALGDIHVVWNNINVTAVTGFVAAVSTAASATTGDVRGTYAVQTTASNGTIRLQIFNTPSVADLLSTSGLFGVTQA